mgnify:CR=1 FL=1
MCSLGPFKENGFHLKCCVNTGKQMYRSAPCPQRSDAACRNSIAHNCGTLSPSDAEANVTFRWFSRISIITAILNSGEYFVLNFFSLVIKICTSKSLSNFWGAYHFPCLALYSFVWIFSVQVDNRTEKAKRESIVRWHKRQPIPSGSITMIAYLFLRIFLSLRQTPNPAMPAANARKPTPAPEIAELHPPDPESEGVPDSSPESTAVTVMTCGVFLP